VEDPFRPLCTPRAKTRSGLGFLIFFQFVSVKSDSQADVSALIFGVDLLLHSPLFFQASMEESEITVQKH